VRRVILISDRDLSLGHFWRAEVGQFWRAARQARLGLAAAIKLAKDSAAFIIEWVDDDLHALGIGELERSKKRRLSLVDHISFLVMRRRHLTAAFAFDPDFTSAGFRLIEG
jgi:predicted nucleic acid-binding protein